jgi:tetratricopeptide (TPR) repeat protein
MTRYSRLVLVAASASILGGCRHTVAETAAVQPLSAACQAALAPGTHRTPVDLAIGNLQQRARDTLRKREALEQLGYQFVNRARLANDPGDYVLAERVATCIDEQNSGDLSALLLRGHALHQLHRFHEAEAIARTLVAKREFVLDYALLGDTLMEQGRLTDAAAAYQKMIDLKPFYQSYTRAAHVRWLNGDLDGAIELIQKSIAAASPRNPEAIAWAYSRLAGYELQRGDLERATAAIDSALSFEPDYAVALLARGRVLLAQIRPSQALSVLERAARLNPLPEYQWTLADALRRVGRDGEATSVEQQLAEQGVATDPRTVALFLSTRGIAHAQALSLTERELDVRRDVFTEDARAWALAGAGRFDDASVAMERALSARTNDARLFVHAGVIAASAGRPRDARRWFARAERLRFTLLPSELDLLRSYESVPTTNHAGE